MNWYLAKLVFSIRIADGAATAQFDEQLRVIAAASEHEAFVKARMIGVREEDSFLNTSFHLVKWSFIDVAELKQLPDLADGMELHSAVQEREDADGYTRFVQSKAMDIAERTREPFALAV